MSRTNEPLQPSLPSSVLSIIWYSLRATACTCTTLPLRISNRPDAPLSCVIGQHSPRSNTEAPIFAREALSCSQQRSVASARKRDRQSLQAAADPSNRERVPYRSRWHQDG